MSDVAAAAHTQATLCDFALSDAAGKVNIIGAGVAGLGYEPTSGATTRFSLVVEVSVPGEMCPVDFALEIALLDASGDIADVPGPAGPQKMRIGHMVSIEKPVPPPASGIPREAIRGRQFTVLDFGNGLPLTPGQVYRWRIQIDGDEAAELTYPFAVAGAAAPPVMG